MAQWVWNLRLELGRRSLPRRCEIPNIVRIGFALAIPVGCVDEIDSRIESLVDDPNRFVVVGITHAAEHHRAQAIRANLAAEITME